MTQAFASAFPTDFLEPWKLSDLVLVVEDQKFHVHRGILAFWSPVFEKMFTSEFKEKNKDEIPLPGKKAREIQTFLLMMYPSVEEKQVTKANCYFLFELAHEYQIESIARKCEAQMASMVKKRMENDVLDMLIYGQKYELKTLISTCIYEARHLTLLELKTHKRRLEIEPDNYIQIAERIIQRLEIQCKEVRVESVQNLERISQSLYLHVRSKNREGHRGPGTINERLDYVLSDGEKNNVKCLNLKTVAEGLIAQKKAIETLPFIIYNPEDQRDRLFLF